MSLKRILISISTLAVSAASFLGAQHALAQKLTPQAASADAVNGASVQDTKDLEQKVNQLHQQILAAQDQLHQVQAVDQRETSTLNQLNGQAVLMKKQQSAALQAKLAAEQRAALLARQTTQYRPSVQATTRASGEHHDGGDDGGDD